VREVQASRTAERRRRRRRAKTDAEDAQAIARATLAHPDLPPAGNVKRWQDGQMALRWCAAGMVEAAKQFRRVNGYLHLPALCVALEAEAAGAVTPACEGQEVVEAA
jgi:hypothetical protein